MNKNALILLVAGIGAAFVTWGIAAHRKMPTEAEFIKMREDMVKFQIIPRGVKDKRIISAMRKVPRHELVPKGERAYAYEDHPLPIGYGQTISQPYIVAYMTEALELKDKDKVLEIGTGSGYQAAILAEMGVEVYSIEIVEELAERAKKDLARLGYEKVKIRAGDGYKGWPEEKPFDAVILTAAPPEVPKPLLAQLKVGGRLVAPVGSYFQNLIRYRRTDKGYSTEDLLPVSFVPMTGEAQKKSR